MRQLDWDGSATLSPELVLQADARQWPCPTAALLLGDSQLPFTTGDFTDEVPAMLWDGLGRLVWHGRLLPADFPELKPGIYHLQAGDTRSGHWCSRSVVVLR